MPEEEVRRVAFETARLRLARAQRSTSHARESGFRLATQVAADALKVDRVSVWMFEDGNQRLVCKTLYSRLNRRYEPGSVLDAREIPNYVEGLRQRRVLSIEDARTHPTTSDLVRSYLGPYGISSLLDAPIIREGLLIGVVCHEELERRRWTQEEIDFAGTVADIIALILEQAERVELEAALKWQTEQRLERQKLEAIGRMARSVGHDLNNLLTVVMSVAEESQTNPCPVCARTAENLSGTAEVGRRLVRQLFDLGRREPEQNGVINVATVLDTMLPTLKVFAGGGVQLDIKKRAGNPYVRIPQAELEQVILNLVVNAREAITGNGAIEVVVRDPDNDEDLPPDGIVLEVIDDGSGMDPETRARLFEPYFTTKPQGNGLGLAIIYGIVRRAGGSINVASEPGNGSVFRVVLPRDLRHMRVT
jgi:signal transduction histidine kinase